MLDVEDEAGGAAIMVVPDVGAEVCEGAAAVPALVYDGGSGAATAPVESVGAGCDTAVDVLCVVEYVGIAPKDPVDDVEAANACEERINASKDAESVQPT